MEVGAKSKDGSPIGSAIWLLERMAKRVTRLMAYVGMGALIIAIAVVIGDIVWRRIGGRSFIGAVDLTQFSVMAAASWSIPYAFAHQNHVTVDLLGGLFSQRGIRLLDALAALVGAGITGFLLWLTYGRAMQIWDYGDVSQDLALPMIAYWSFLISGLAVSVIVCLINVLIFLTPKYISDDD